MEYIYILKLQQQDQAVHQAESKNQEESSKLKAEFVKTLEVRKFINIFPYF